MQVVAISNGTVRQRKEKNLASFNRGNGQGAENRICYGKLVIMCIYFDILLGQFWDKAFSCLEGWPSRCRTIFPERLLKKR